MRRVLAAAVLVAFMPTANAQDKAKSDFSSNAEFRARWFMFQNPGANENNISTKSHAEGRFKIDLGYKASEKLAGHATLIHSATFGESGTGSVGSTATAGNESVLLVNQAFAKWMTSDDLSFSVGRMNYQVADGTLIGINDWETMPYAYEGLLTNWEQEFGKIQFVAFKLRDQNFGTNSTTSATADPEHNMYGLNFDLKSKPEVLKALNVHVFKNNSDAIQSGAVGTGKVMTDDTDGFDTLRYGVMAGLGFGDIELNLWYENQGGEYKHVTAAGTKTSYDYKGSLMQAELAYNLESLMGSRFAFKYHQDSGDDNTTDTEDGTYDGFFTEKHNSAGAMDLFGFGNLTFMQLAWTAKPMDKTTVGLQYTMFSRTEAAAGATPSDGFTPGTYGGDLPTGANDKDDLGSEIDVWATHSYDANLSTTFRVGYFMPGDYFKDTATNNTDDKVMQVMLEGKATF